MVFSQQFLQTICYFKRVDSYIVRIIVDFLITVVIITSPASLILQKRPRRRDRFTSDITSLVIGNHTDVLLIWYLTCMTSFSSQKYQNFVISKIFKLWMMPYDPDIQMAICYCAK